MIQTPETAIKPISFIDAGIIEIFGEGIFSHETSPVSPFVSLYGNKQQSISQFGLKETNGLLIRAGRAAFYKWMTQNAASLGWREVDFRLLPPQARTRRALLDLLHWLSEQRLLDAVLTDSAEIWEIKATGLDRPEAGLDRYTFLGMLQELVGWIGGGKFFPAQEDRCQAFGADCCIFKIDRHPVD